jgi:outer membrane lipoprotein carrier protein
MNNLRSPSTHALVAGLAVSALALAAAAGANAQSAPDAEDIVANVQQYYAGVGDYRCEFVQTTAHKLFPGRLERSYGRLMFKKGGLTRWEYSRPEHKLFVWDGKTLWIHEPEVPQVFTGTADAERLRRGLAFLTGEGRLLEDYQAKKLDAGKYGFAAAGHVLKLTPKAKGSPFKYVEIYVDGTSHRVVRSVVVDHEGNRNRLDFEKPEINVGLADDLFSFTPPPGVPVIRAE